MSKTFKSGERIVPLERDASVFTKADSITMPHAAGESTPPLPKPDKVESN